MCFLHDGAQSFESSKTHMAFQNGAWLNLCRPAPSKFKIFQRMLMRISHLGRRLIFLNLLIGTNQFDILPTTKRYSYFSKWTHILPWVRNLPRAIPPLGDGADVEWEGNNFRWAHNLRKTLLSQLVSDIVDVMICCSAAAAYHNYPVLCCLT